MSRQTKDLTSFMGCELGKMTREEFANKCGAAIVWNGDKPEHRYEEKFIVGNLRVYESNDPQYVSEIHVNDISYVFFASMLMQIKFYSDNFREKAFKKYGQPNSWDTRSYDEANECPYISSCKYEWHNNDNILTIIEKFDTNNYCYETYVEYINKSLYKEYKKFMAKYNNKLKDQKKNALPEKDKSLDQI